MCPLILVYFAFYVVPLLVYKVESWNHYERKSEKEESFMSSSVRLMINNCLILPFFGATLLNYYFGEFKSMKFEFPYKYLKFQN